MTAPLFIGDISAADASTLAALVPGRKRIVEFGVGGSTQIIAQSMDADAVLWAYDTDPEWLTRTAVNLETLGVDRSRVLLLPSYEQHAEIPGPVDLAFVDCAERFRIPFAHLIWPRLSVGGLLVLHDARPLVYVQPLLALVADNFRDVRSVTLNADDTNFAIVERGPRRDYADWNAAEGREPWEAGYAEAPVDWVERLRAKRGER